MDEITSLSLPVVQTLPGATVFGVSSINEDMSCHLSFYDLSMFFLKTPK
jgi:hypothetical protein